MSYENTLVHVAPDSRLEAAQEPPGRAGAKTVAGWQYHFLAAYPYQLTERELYFKVHCARQGISATEALERKDEIMATVFARPQACMRASPLPKNYGWGVHYDEKGRIALVAMESQVYRNLAASALKQVYAMRSKR